MGGGGSSWPADVEAGSFAPGGIDFDVDAVAGEDLADGPEAQAVALNALVVTLNSKILGRTSGEMPVPSPVTVSHEIRGPLEAIQNLQHLILGRCRVSLISWTFARKGEKGRSMGVTMSGGGHCGAHKNDSLAGLPIFLISVSKRCQGRACKADSIGRTQ